MGLFGTYNTIEKAKKTYDKVRNGKIKVPQDTEMIKSLTDNDKLFSYALTDNAEVSRTAIAAINDPLAIRRLIELQTGRPDILVACSCNPCRRKEDLNLILQQTDNDIRKIIVSKLTDRDELREVATTAQGSGVRLLAIKNLKEPDDIEYVLDRANDKEIEVALQRLTEVDTEYEGRLIRMTKNALGIPWYDQALRFRKKIRDSKEADEATVDALLKELEKDGMYSGASKLLETVNDQESLFRFANSAKIEERSFGCQNRELYKKYKKDEENKEALVRYAVNRLQDDGLLSQLVYNHLTSKTAIKRINDPQILVKAIESGKLFDSELDAAIDRLCSMPEGQTCLIGLLTERIKSRNSGSVKETMFISRIEDEDCLYEIIEKHPDYRYRRQAIERFINISRSNNRIVDILRTEDLNVSLLISKTDDASFLKQIALTAKNSKCRSNAAGRLFDLGIDTEHIEVLHDVCPLCGGNVIKKTVHAGTIESHLYYECSGCGNSHHETILDDDLSTVIGDYYRYKD